jgi:hypothetical protein
LIAADDEHIEVQETEGKGKKASIKTSNILFNQIKHAKVLVTF